MNHLKPAFLFLFIVMASSLVQSQVITNLDDLGSTQILLDAEATNVSVSGIGDFDGDGFRDVAVGLPNFNNDLENGINNGAVFIIFGRNLTKENNTIDIMADDFDGIRAIGRTNSKVGNSLAEIGDINADGFDDLAFGSETYQSGFILFGDSDPSRLMALTNLGQQGVEILNTGWSVSTAGDFNGDGFDDVIFGNPFSGNVEFEGETYNRGRVTIVFGNNQFPPQINALEDARTHVSISSIIGDSNFGQHITGGFDMNHDNFSDILVVSPNGGDDLQGQAYMIFGQSLNNQADTNIFLRNTRKEKEFYIKHARRYVRYANDLNADGYPDLIFGRELNNGNWSIYLLWGSEKIAPNYAIDFNDDLGNQLGTTIVGAINAYAVGDLNGDGFQDLAVAQPHANVGDNVEAGRVIFIFGASRWPDKIDVQRLAEGEPFALNYIVLNGNEAFGTFGSSIAGIGDIQNDGFDDVIISAPTDVLPGETRSDKIGKAYVIQGLNLWLSLQNQRSVLKPFEPDTVFGHEPDLPQLQVFPENQE